MSDILCKWLNEELRLSKAVEPKTFAKTFCSGYLIGEVLHKYQLQNDFSLFMKKDTSVSKLNNFTRLEPTLQLLGISFNLNTAQELIQEKQGVATRLLYQLYVSLEKKKKAEISGTVMEIMQPAASAGLHKKGHEIYSDRLHRVVKRDAELKLQQITQHYQEKINKWNDQSVMTDPIQPRRQLKVQDDKRMKNIEKLGMYNQKHNGIINGNQAAIAQVPKPPPYTSQLSLKKRQRQKQRKEQQAQTMQTEITQFEMNRKKLVPYGVASSSSGQPISGEFPLGGSSSQGCEVPGNGTKLILQTSSKYIQDIRQRLEENAAAREQREKRRDRFLVEQLRAHEAQEEARREEHLVKRLTRQTQQEERLAAQLLHIRMQKEVIQDNHLFREQQYQQRRQRDFQEALEREAALAQQAKLEGAEEIRKELEFCNRIAAERAQSRYKKHFTSCKEIVEQIVDLSTKVGEYRLVTGNLIPEKAMRGWKELLLIGLPLYEPINDQQPGFEFSTLLDPVELEKQEILKNQDYDEYTNMLGEWAWLEEVEEAKLPLTNNNILGHVVCRLRNILHQPIIMKPSTPSFPHFTLKACVLGKFCSGKTTFMAKIAKAHGISVLSADTLIEEALNAFQNGELSARAMQGAAAEGELRKGNHISNELLVDIIVEAIRRVPAQSGWILDGFPVDICQAYLLEEALGGSVDVEDAVVSSRTNLAADPNPPKPPPPAVPVLDLALLLDIPDECVVRRAFTQTDADTADATTSHPTDRSLYLAQVPHRITAFQDTWPNLEKWFGEKLNILARVDADVDNEELCRRVESVLQQVMLQIQKAPVEDVQLDSGKAPDSTSSGAPPSEDQPLALTGQDPGPAESYASLNEESVKSLSKSNTQSPKEPSGMELTSSATNEDPKNTTESDSPLLGSSSWVYVDQPFPPDISEYLCPHWDTMCDSYVNSVKTVMQQLRSQCTVIDHHLYNIREEFRHYLGRPNLKQELVTQWQKDFNTIPDDMREDEETKAELHLRLDELCERLWDISEKRKEEDEQERAALGEGWIEEHSAVLINHHSVLMQVEFDRFQDTLYILKVYYLSMQTQVLPEIPSKFVCIPLLNKDPDERTEPTGTTLSSQADNGEDKRGTKFIPFLPRRPDASVEVPKAKDQIQTEPVKPSHEKLIADYVEALSAIRNSVSAELQQREAKEKKPDKERPKTSASKKGKQSSKQKAPPSPPPSPEEKTPEQIREEELRNKIQQEYAAALVHEENSAKVHIALVKSHGLLMLDFLQSRAEQTFSSIQKWLEAQYLAEMKSIEHLSEVARHHIETSAKLQNELVLELNDFYLNGDCRMVASPPPPPRPPPSEKPIRSTLTITQLESLHQQLCAVAPTGLFFSSEFNSLLRDVISVNMGRNTLPDPWLEKNETQLLEIVSLLTDTFELIDWRRFLLSAALPWPFPSLTQLLVTLQRFKVADPEDSGYLNEEQYLHTKLWFSNESVQPVPEDPSEPIPYDRLANLRKFFFKLFADHSFSPSRLDYVSMLQYFAADPNPRQGFIRALSVVLGQHLKLPLTGHLVKSMPSLEDAIEVSPADLDGEYMEEDALCASSSLFREQEVSIPALLAVICHKAAKTKDHNPLPPGCLSEEEHAEHLLQIFKELGYNPEDCIPFSVLSQHPLIQSLMETTTHHQLVNIHRVLLAHLDEGRA